MANKPKIKPEIKDNLHTLIADIHTVIALARTQVKQTVNSAMVQAYWQIDRLIVEDEQQGQVRAQYGKAQLKLLKERERVQQQLSAKTKIQADNE